MEAILNEESTHEDIKKFEEIYKSQVRNNEVTTKALFEYAWCLVRSKYSADIRKGIALLEQLFETHLEGRRDYLYYLAIGNVRIKEYKKSLDYIKAFLSIEPGNQQVLQLQQIVKKRLEIEGLTGMAKVGGAIMALGVAAAIGIQLAKKH